MLRTSLHTTIWMFTLVNIQFYGTNCTHVIFQTHVLVAHWSFLTGKKKVAVEVSWPYNHKAEESQYLLGLRTQCICSNMNSSPIGHVASWSSMAGQFDGGRLCAACFLPPKKTKANFKFHLSGPWLSHRDRQFCYYVKLTSRRFLPDAVFEFRWISAPALGRMRCLVLSYKSII